MKVKELIEILYELPQDHEVLIAESSSLSNLHPPQIIKEMYAMRYSENLFLGTDDPTGIEQKVEEVVVLS